MNSINYRSINLILIEGKSLGQMSRSIVGEHLQKEVKIAWIQEKQIIPHSAHFFWKGD